MKEAIENAGLRPFGYPLTTNSTHFLSHSTSLAQVLRIISASWENEEKVLRVVRISGHDPTGGVPMSVAVVIVTQFCRPYLRASRTLMMQIPSFTGQRYLYTCTYGKETAAKGEITEANTRRE